MRGNQGVCLASLLLLAGCGGGDGGGAEALPAGCQPLGPELSCTLPFPSDFFLRDGHVVMEGAGAVALDNGTDANLFEAFPSDGASRQPLIAASLPGELVPDGLPNLVDDPEASATATSATVILDTETGAFVPHYVDIDPRSEGFRNQALILRPHNQLAPSRRYIVALQGVRTSGGLASAPTNFARMRDGVVDLSDAAASTNTLVTTAARFETDVFPALIEAGLPRESLQLAWDFTTGSAEGPTRDMLRVRDLTLAWLEDHAPEVTVINLEENDGNIWRWVRATVTAPGFLESDEPTSRLARGDDGAVIQNGETTFEFLALIPNTLRDQFGPGRIIGYSHGFFGSVDSAFPAPDTRKVSNDLRAILIGTNLKGFATDDLGTLLSVTQDPQAALAVVDHTHQAMANWLVLNAVMPTLGELPEFQRPASGPGTSINDAEESNAGEPLFTPTPPRYFGASMSAILGATLVSLDPTIDRAVLQVGGGAFSQVFFRSAPFAPLDFVLDSAMSNPLARCAFLSMLSAPLDRVDPASYVAELFPNADGAIPEGPADQDRRVVLQIARGDNAVPNAASFLYARAAGLSLTSPAPFEPWSVPVAEADTLTSGVTLYDYGIESEDERIAQPPPDNRGHLEMRINPATLEQMDTLLRDDGVVIHPCDGVCDPD
jgi:hypothetical protein